MFRALLALAILGGPMPLRAAAAVHYVDVNSTNPTPPYTNWPTAATNIQDAVDAASVRDEVVVADGIYASGSRPDPNGYGDRVVVDKPLGLRSVSGAQFTVIDAGQSNRCAYLTNGASLSGFTLTNGYDAGSEGGGGVHGGTMSNCVLTGNGAYLGGGAAFCTLNNCTLSWNSAFEAGGGAYYCALNNCTLVNNSASGEPYGASGGGAYYSTLFNCTLMANSAAPGPLGHGSGGGIYGGSLYNCIVYYNTAQIGANYYQFSSMAWCCTWPSATGLGNIISQPLFVNRFSGDLRLQSNSPCINAGNNSSVGNAADLDGNPRIVGGTVDIGAYEYQSLSLINFGVVSNQAGFDITGQSNQVIIVEASTDMLNWSPLATNTLSSHPFSFSDPTPATLPRRFYRANAQ
jgi:hypothetical protein